MKNDVGDLGRLHDIPTPAAPVDGGPPTGPVALEQALALLCARQQQSLSELIAEARRCDELCAALPAALAPQQLGARQAEIAEAILGIVKGWQALGGTVQLAPPSGLAPLPRAEPLPPTQAPSPSPPAQRPAEAAPVPSAPAPALPPPRLPGALDPNRRWHRRRRPATGRRIWAPCC